MEAYTGFAGVYDLFMDDIPYEEWCRYLVGLLRDHGVTDGLVAELGCGTGKMTRLLAGAGYDMIGIDRSDEMLGMAMEQRTPTGAADILYLQQDMREFELYGTVRAIASICDSMNYLLEYEDLVRVLRLANNYLDPGGVMIFDLNTVYKYSQLLGERTIAENCEEGSFIWENDYDEDTRINEYDLTLYIRGTDGRFDRCEETHYQRAYTTDEVWRAIGEAGMEFVAAYDAFTKEPVREDSERIYVIAREKGKKR